MALAKTAKKYKNRSLNQQSSARIAFGSNAVCLIVHNYGWQYGTEQFW